MDQNLNKGGSEMDGRMAQICRKQNSFVVYVLLTFLALVISSGCVPKVKLVGEYDAIVDKAVTDLQEQTDTFFVKIKTDSNYEANKGFYDDIQAKITTLIRRSEVIEEGLKKNPLTQNFKDLQIQYQELANRNKKGFSDKYLESAKKAFDQSFRAILANLLYLKWNQTQPSK
jgi:hypothetical protein